MSDNIKWGFIGLGSIARRFGNCFQYASGAEIYAVASRSQEKADAFGAEFGATKRYDSYEALVNDPAVDVVYIGTPHNYHKPHTLLALNAGKPVLCEKPFAVNAAEAQVMIDCARAKNLFLMDAFWTRFFPVMGKLRQLLADEVIGDVMLVQADFGYRTGQIMPESRTFNPDLAGGALLDVGSYPVQLASMVYGKQPSEIVSQYTLGSTGVDELSVSVFKYSDYEMATITTSIRLNTPQVACIMGSKGMISIAPHWWCPTELTVKVNGQDAETHRFDRNGEGFQYEIEAVGQCLRAGLTESDVMPLDETLAIMQTLDRMRESWGLRYPIES